jgi:hypothetical protein
LQRAKAGQCLARIANRRACSTRLIDETRGERRVPREQRREVQHRALVRKEERERAFQGCDARAANEACAIFAMRRQLQPRATRHHFNNRHSAKHAIRTTLNARSTTHVGRNRRAARDVALETGI